MFKKLTLALVICGAALGGVAMAQAPNGAPDPARKAEFAEGAEQASSRAPRAPCRECIPVGEFKAKRQAKKQQMLQRFDTNKNGMLDKDERVAMHDTMSLEYFTKLDTDGNGVLSLAEFKAGTGKLGKRLARGGFHGKRGHGPRGGQGTK